MQIPWSSLAKLLGLSESMCYHVARGTRKLGRLSLARLENFERGGEFVERVHMYVGRNPTPVDSIMETALAIPGSMPDRFPGENSLRERIRFLRFKAAHNRAMAEQWAREADSHTSEADKLEQDLLQKLEQYKD